MKAYETHVLKLFRTNNGSIHSTAESNDKKSRSDIAEILQNQRDIYFMFDYFDLMTYEILNEESKKYVNFLGMEESFDDLKFRGVTEKLLALYRSEEQSAEGVLSSKEDHNQQLAADSEEFLSKTPYIGIIQIGIHPKAYQDNQEKDAFLSKCESDIQSVIDKVKAIYSSSKYSLLHTLTTGDFCLIVKSEDIHCIYQLAGTIGTYLSQQEYPIFTTYTNVGVEIKMAADRLSFLTFGDETIKKCVKDRYTLRFSVKSNYINKIMACLKDSLNQSEYQTNTNELRGLFGRYDFLIRLNISQFSILYPYLCDYKLGIQEQELFDEEENQGNSLINTLIDGIRKGYIFNLNERVLTEPYMDAPEAAQQATLEVNDIEELKADYKWLKEQGNEFNIVRRNFIDTLRVLKELIHIYASLRYGTDSYLNGKIQHTYLRVLFDNLKRAIPNLPTAKGIDFDDMDLKRHYVYDFKLCVEAINQFTRFLQNINMQTVQAPQYEIQTKIDSEKLIIAYHEYMYQYLDTYYKMGNRPHFLPIIYPDASVDKVEVQVPFSEGYQYDVDGTMSFFVICRVPSFEYFGRVYEMLPWLTHEIGHSMRILKRDERNDQLLEVIFDNIFQNVVQRWLSDNDTKRLIFRYGHLKDNLAEILSKEYLTYYKKYVNPLYKENRMMDLEYSILLFFSNYFNPKDRATYADINLTYNYEEAVKKLLEELIGLGLRYHILSKKDKKELIQNADSYGKENKGEDFLNHIYEWLKSIYKKLLREYDKRIYKEMEKLQTPLNYKLPHLTFTDIIWSDRSVLDKKIMDLLTRNKEIKLPKEIFRNQQIIMRDYFYEVLKINQIYFSFQKIYQGPDLKKIDSSKLEGVLSSIHKKMEPYHNSEKAECFILDMDLINVLSAAGYNHDEMYTAKQMLDNLHSSMSMISIDNYQRWLGHSVTYYREVCADLIMCKILGLNAFGYVRMFMKFIGEVDYEPIDITPDLVSMERLRIVASVLIYELEMKDEMKSGLADRIKAKGSKLTKKEITIKYDRMYEETKEFCIHLLKQLEIKIKDRLKGTSFTQPSNLRDNPGDRPEYNLEDNLECCTTTIGAAIEHIEVLFNYAKRTDIKYSDINSIFTTGAFWRDEEKWKAAKKYKPCYMQFRENDYIFDRIYNMMNGVFNIFIGHEITISSNRFKQFAQFYKRVNLSPFNETEVNGSSKSNINNEIRDYYNSTDRMGYFETGKKLNTLIEFFEEYYYENRFRIADVNWEKLYYTKKRGGSHNDEL
ncbi:MAG: hypothetical protein K0R92_1270 [Lachnospiraceae bacterium]|jgi:hypothetical protein|nr:hypothetical protein [Lachnospiraceae bacterium]MDF2843400.1 hypothetical protein [Herbinix sp.]